VILDLPATSWSLPHPAVLMHPIYGMSTCLTTHISALAVAAAKTILRRNGGGCYITIKPWSLFDGS